MSESTETRPASAPPAETATPLAPPVGARPVTPFPFQDAGRERRERLRRLEALWNVREEATNPSVTGRLRQTGRILMGLSFLLDNRPGDDTLEFLDGLLTEYLNDGGSEPLDLEAVHLLLDTEPSLIASAARGLAERAQQTPPAAA